MQKILFFLFIPFFLSAQEGVVKSVVLDSVMILAVRDGFSVEEFVHYVKTDTTFYQGFKNLRYYNHDFNSELSVLKKSGEPIGSLFRKGKYIVENERLVVQVDSAFDDGRIYNRKGAYRYYTPEFFDYVFFPEDTLDVTKHARKGDEEGSGENEGNEKDAKVIIFNPGSVEVESGSGSKKEKLAVFDINMQQYYDYTISKETYQDSIECYEFTCRMKSDLEPKEQKEVLIRELVSYFDKKTFNVMYRKYVMSYRYWLIDLDVTVEVYMDYADGELIPAYIHYNGFWDIPFNKPEYADFKLWSENFKVKP